MTLEASTGPAALTDATIDALMPRAVRLASSRYWTPVAVAQRVARIVGDLGARRVMDIGSGPGKLCIVAGAHAPSVTFVGMEQRPRLVEVACTLAKHLGTANATFVVGDATKVSWREFDAFYVFNSFTENVLSRLERFDQTVEFSRARRMNEVMRVLRRLEAAPLGTLLLTYHGLSGPIPLSYKALDAESVGTGWLRTWRKEFATARDGNDRYWLEDGESVAALPLRELAACLRDDEPEGEEE